MAVAPAVGGPVTEAPPDRRMRVDIQALRAVAVLLVVANHLWPGRLTGGFVGVDVFFVISGFLITAHLSRELVSTGRIGLGRFYARRVRRLLPAAFLVLAVAVIGTFLLLPELEWRRGALEVLASTFYVENWALAAQSVDYSAQNDAATAVQHYWSLSVEEQFYLVWPVLLLLTWWLAGSSRTTGARHAARTGERRTGVSGSTGNGPILALLVTVGSLSLLASVLLTSAEPAQAYFVTPTRAWEFAVGGCVAVALEKGVLGRVPATAMAIVGWVAIGASAVLYSAATPFPGVAAAVPVLGTALVLAANTDRWPDGGLTRLQSLGVVQWTGNTSYSLYLWHWPLIVFAPYVLGHHPGLVDRLGVLVVALVLAGATRVWVEAPGQRIAWLRASSARTFGAMGVGMLVITALCGGLLLAYRASPAAVSAVPDERPEPTTCEGPASALDPTCGDIFARPVDAPQMIEANAYYNAPDECRTDESVLVFGDLNTTTRCDFSGGDDDAPSVWLVGDSHAQQWQWLVFDLGRELGWDVTTSYVGGCPPADVAFVGYRGGTAPDTSARCMAWSDAVASQIAQESPDLVFTSAFTRMQQIDDGSGEPAQEQWEDGLTRYWESWLEAGSRIVVIGDPPLNGDVRDPNCIVQNADSPETCGVAAPQANPQDPMLEAAREMADPRVVPFDTSPYFCDAERCYGAAGGVPAYFDADHLNLEFTRMVALAFLQQHPDLAIATTG